MSRFHGRKKSRWDKLMLTRSQALLSFNSAAMTAVSASSECGDAPSQSTDDGAVFLRFAMLSSFFSKSSVQRFYCCLFERLLVFNRQSFFSFNATLYVA